MPPTSLQPRSLAVLASGIVTATTESTGKPSIQCELFHTKNSIHVHAYSGWEETYSVDRKPSFHC